MNGWLRSTDRVTLETDVLTILTLNGIIWLLENQDRRSALVGSGAKSKLLLYLNLQKLQ